MEFCLLMYADMEHISAVRLMKLCAEAIVQDEQEAEHLKMCVDCRLLLRQFAEERFRSLQGLASPKTKNDNFKKSA